VDEPAPVAVSLSSVRVVHSGPHLLFICQAVLHNRTGDTLTVLSNFHSPFDLITIVVRSPSGAELFRQAYVSHQSPYAMDQPIELPPGETAREIRFPIESGRPLAGPVDIQLVGGLRAASYETGLISNVQRADIVSE